jgi:cytochrome P450
MTEIFSDDRVYQKLMDEIDKATRAGRISAGVPRYEDVMEHCPYYVACVKEAMRLNPSAPNIFPRLAPKDGLNLFGKFVPEGSEVTCNPWIVHRDPNIYGSNAEVFYPERWLEDAEKVKDYNKYNMGFGYGARVCLGREIANMELFKAPLQFLRTFKPQAVNPEQAGRYVYKGGISFFEDMWITIEKRPSVSP